MGYEEDYTRLKLGHRPLSPTECMKVKLARKRLTQIGRSLDGIPLEPAKERTLASLLEAADYRLYLVQHQLCKRSRRR